MSLLGRALDRSILFSFDRGGFRRHRRDFHTEDLEVDFSGRTFVVTGANSGLGKATARGLAERGGEVWMLSGCPRGSQRLACTSHQVP